MASRLKRNKKIIGESLGVLDANAGHLSETAHALNLPKSTLRTWRDNYATDPLVARYRALKNEDLAERFRVISAMASERLQAELDDVHVDKLATVAAIGADKQLLLTGHSTDIDKMLQRLVEKLQSALPDISPDELKAFIIENAGVITEQIQ